MSLFTSLSKIITISALSSIFSIAFAGEAMRSSVCNEEGLRFGTDGGFVSKLAQVKAKNIAKNVHICGAAHINGDVVILDNAVINASTIEGRVTISGKAYVGPYVEIRANNSSEGRGVSIAQNARVMGFVHINGNATITGNAVVYNKKAGHLATVRDNAHVSGKAFVTEDALVGGNARILENSQIKGNAEVAGSAQVMGFKILTAGKTTSGIHTAKETEEARAKREERERARNAKRVELLTYYNKLVANLSHIPNKLNLRYKKKRDHAVASYKLDLYQQYLKPGSTHCVFSYASNYNWHFKFKDDEFGTTTKKRTHSNSGTIDLRKNAVNYRAARGKNKYSIYGDGYIKARAIYMGFTDKVIKSKVTHYNGRKKNEKTGSVKFIFKEELQGDLANQKAGTQNLNLLADFCRKYPGL